MKALLITSLFLFSSFVKASDAFVQTKSDENTHQVIKIVNEDVLEVRRDAATQFYPDISSDGRVISFSEGESKSTLDLYLFHPEVERKEKWTNLNLEVTGGRFSKNSQFIFYSAPKDGENKIFYIDLLNERINVFPKEIKTEQGSIWDYSLAKKEFIDLAGNFFSPAPTQDGTIIYFERDFEGVSEIISYNLNTKEYSILDEGQNPSLSKGENFLAYTKSKDGFSSIYVKNLQTGEVLKVTGDNSFDYDPSFDRFDNILFSRLEGSTLRTYKAQKSGDHFDVSLYYSLSGSSLSYPRFSGVLNLKQIQKTKMLAALSHFGAVTHQNKAFVAGGITYEEESGASSFSNKTFYYDYYENNWHQAASKLTKASDFTLIAFGNYLYAFGGLSIDNEKLITLDLVERYDLTNNEWKIVGKMPHARYAHITEVIDGKAYLMGGSSTRPGEATSVEAIDVFDLNTETFLEEKGSTFKGEHSTSTLYEGKIMLAGGRANQETSHSLLSYDPVKDELKVVSKLPYDVYGASSFILGGEFYLLGGNILGPEGEEKTSTFIYKYNFTKKAFENTGRYLKEGKAFSRAVKTKTGYGVMGGEAKTSSRMISFPTFETFD